MGLREVTEASRAVRLDLDGLEARLRGGVVVGYARVVEALVAVRLG
jgi:hypothetical protein